MGKSDDVIESFEIITTDENDNLLKLTWQTGSQSLFPMAFLRDNCTCVECFHPTSKQKTVSTFEAVPLNISGTPSIESDAKTVRILWHGKRAHESYYAMSWLKARDPSSRYSSFDPLELWLAEDMQDKIKTFAYDAVLKDDVTQAKWIETLWTKGIALIRGMPAECGTLRTFGKQISQVGLKKTHYGEIFTVKSKLDPCNLAYTQIELPLHSDLCYCSQKPDIQMLHCIHQAAFGGSSVFADAFKIANDFRKDFPAHFNILSTTPISFSDVGEDEFGPFDVRLDRPLIELDFRGQVHCMNISNFTRHSQMVLPPYEELQFYRAYYNFMKYYTQPKYVIKLRLEQGDMIAFNNNRVLHGRERFELTQVAELNDEDCVRHMEGAYLEWDTTYSKLRVLRAKLK